MEGESVSILSFVVMFSLILLNGFFVAAEFAIVKIRPTKIEQLERENNRRAKFVRKVVDEMDMHLAAAQLGITLTSLGIGWIAEPSIAVLIENAFRFMELNISATVVQTISFVIAFSIATYLHITIGEQVPKMWAIQKNENVSLMVALPLYIFCKITYLPIQVLKKSTDVMLKVVGVDSRNEEEAHSTEEIKMILSRSPDLGPEQQKMLTKIFDFDDRFVREIMVHRKDMDIIYIENDRKENIAYIKESKHSRFPVCGEDRDDILGFINVRDLYSMDEDGQEVDLKQVIRNIPKIYEMRPIKQALKEMQKGHYQMAIVTDEYGGVSGLITIEDILEEIVGEIQDEYDNEVEPIRKYQDKIRVDAGVLIDQVNDELSLNLEEIDGIDTIGGYILTKIENPPKVGQTIELDDFDVKILETEENRIKLLEFKQIDEKEKLVEISKEQHHVS
ncbi:hemolysin family protein [Aquibacillus salsiterrae]|uniref:Hemolysin family protein n=1 Tax=Aquibacillus salsiterrae TaxID=2950439 RepID=A0A9X3WG62_9BACI|nr:hemolysin family protein [Aquibacillus salsiterrae]MDC3418053.1 hemolysin family protein [Aquibacillus salsiterrae]